MWVSRTKGVVYWYPGTRYQGQGNLSPVPGSMLYPGQNYKKTELPPGRSVISELLALKTKKFHIEVSNYFNGSLTGLPIPKWWNISRYFHLFLLPVTVTKFQRDWLPTSTCWLLTWFAENLKYSQTADFICWVLTWNRWLLTSTCWRQATYFVHRKIPTTCTGVQIVFTFHIWITMEMHLFVVGHWCDRCLLHTYYME